MYIPDKIKVSWTGRGPRPCDVQSADEGRENEVLKVSHMTIGLMPNGRITFNITFYRDGAREALEEHHCTYDENHVILDIQHNVDLKE